MAGTMAVQSAWRRFWTHRIQSNSRLARGRWWATPRVRGAGASTRKGEDALPPSEADGCLVTTPDTEQEVVTRFAAPVPHHPGEIDGRTVPRVSVSLSDPEVIAALRGILASSLGHWVDGDNNKRLALWSIYHRLGDAEKRLRAKRAAVFASVVEDGEA